MGTRTIEEAIQIVQKNRSSGKGITEANLPVLHNFELSFYNRYPSDLISRCKLSVEASKIVSENPEFVLPPEEDLRDLGLELKSFYKLSLIEKHRDILWEHTAALI